MVKPREKGKIPHTEWPTIRSRHAAGQSLASIARDYGCTGPAIRYIVNRPADADGMVGTAPPPQGGDLSDNNQRPAAEAPPTDQKARVPTRKDDARPDAAGSVSEAATAVHGFDAELRWRVSSEIASFLAVFDSFLTDSSPETYDQLLGATDRLMRVAARTRIELERARTSEHSRLRRGRSSGQPKRVVST